MSVCLCVSLSVCLSACLPACLPAYLPACCLPVCLSVCLSIASDSSETANVTSIKLNFWHSDCIRHVQAMPIKFAVKIVRLKVYILFSQSDDLNLHSRSQLRLKRDTCFTCTTIVIYHRPMHCIMFSLVWMTLAFMQGHSGSAEEREKSSASNVLYN